MKNKKIRLVLVGYGYWGTNLCRNMLNHPGIEVVGLVERNGDLRAKCLASYPQLATFDHLQICLDQVKPDGVVIATPPDSHCALALRALRAGAHVLIEKPMAVTTDECDQILSEAKKMKKSVMVDHTFLYHPPVTYLAREIHLGSYGDLLYYDSVRVNLGGFQWTNVVWDLAPHDLSILDHLLKGRMPTSVSAVGQRHFNAPSESLCYVNLLYDDHFMAHLHLNWAAPVKGRQITIGATQKMVVFDDNTPLEKVRIYDKSVELEKLTESDLRVNYRVGDMVAPAIGQREALSEMLNEFVTSIRENRRALSDGESGRRVVRVLEAISQSLNLKGRPVEIQPKQKRSAA